MAQNSFQITNTNIVYHGITNAKLFVFNARSIHMAVAPLPENERERLLALQYFNIPDMPEKEDFNEIVQLGGTLQQPWHPK